MRYFLGISVVWIFLAAGVSALWAEVIFIVNPSSTIQEADRTLIKEIFLGKITKWPDGSDVNFVLSDEPDTHREFVRTYLRRNPGQFKNHWAKMLFSGKGRAPRTYSPKSVIKFVAETKGAIGYVDTDKDADLSTVKILNVAQ